MQACQSLGIVGNEVVTLCFFIANSHRITTFWVRMSLPILCRCRSPGRPPCTSQNQAFDWSEQSAPGVIFPSPATRRGPGKCSYERPKVQLLQFHLLSMPKTSNLCIAQMMGQEKTWKNVLWESVTKYWEHAKHITVSVAVVAAATGAAVVMAASAAVVEVVLSGCGCCSCFSCIHCFLVFLLIIDHHRHCLHHHRCCCFLLSVCCFLDVFRQPFLLLGFCCWVPVVGVDVTAREE